MSINMCGDESIYMPENDNCENGCEGLASQISDVRAIAEGARTTANTAVSGLANKVDKVTGKGLSTNDFTTAEKVKLAGIAAGATSVTVDSAMNSTSTNPVQNKAIYAALNNKVNKVSGKGLSTNDFTTAEKTKLAGIESGATNITLDNALNVNSNNGVKNSAVAQRFASTDNDIDAVETSVTNILTRIGNLEIDTDYIGATYGGSWDIPLGASRAYMLAVVRFFESTSATHAALYFVTVGSSYEMGIIPIQTSTNVTVTKLTGGTEGIKVAVPNAYWRYILMRLY